MTKKIEIELAPGEVGARRIAHIGVLMILERKNIPIGLIVGTSIGALFGAAREYLPALA